MMHQTGDVARAKVAQDMFRAGIEPEVEDLGGLAGSRRLEANAAAYSFLVDAMGSHLPDPVHETFEPDRLALTVLGWSNEGVDDEERFAFRSVWLAWKAARKLQAARQG